jgi:hypothetical protein
MRTHRAIGLTVLTVCLGASLPATAQHANFVLFPNAPVLSLDPGAASHDNEMAQPPEQMFVHPITQPYFSEDAFVTTDLRPTYAYQTVSDHSLLGGGEAQVIAMPLRVAITDQIGLVAYKDGYDIVHTGAVKGDGWNDLAAGLKWSFWQDWQHQTFASVGVGYQFPTGESTVLQNKEEIRAWFAVDQGFDSLHVGGVFNYFFADGHEGPLGATDHFSINIHTDYWINQYISPVIEGNLYQVIRNRNGVLPIQGADFTNLGDGKSDTIATVGVGLEVRPLSNIAIRAAWEKNVTHPSDLIDSRVTVSAIISF